MVLYKTAAARLFRFLHITNQKTCIRWSGTIFTSKYPEVMYPKIGIPEYMFQKCLSADIRDRPAVIDGITGASITYQQLWNNSQAFAKSLNRLTCGPDFKTGRDVVCLYAANSSEFLVAQFGVLSAGLILSLASSGYTQWELDVQLKHCKATVLITTSALESIALKTISMDANSRIKNVIIIGESSSSSKSKSFDKMIQEGLTMENSEPLPINHYKDVALLPYSSGTSGLPKGVMLTHENMVANVSMLNIARPLTMQERQIIVLPMTHVYATILCLMGVRNCSTLIVLTRFEQTSFLNCIQNYKVTNLQIVPPIVLFLAQNSLVEKYDMTSVESINSAAAPLGIKLEQQLRERFSKLTNRKVLVLQGYGMTETGTAVAATHQLLPIKCGSAGFLLPNVQIKIICPQSNEMKDVNEIGELFVKSPSNMVGYWDNQVATEQCIDQDGWLKTGDIGYIDDEGYLFIVDRVKDLIKYKGMQIAPAELEDLLVTHPGIKDAAVIGISDEECGELPVAYVVLKANFVISEDEIKNFVNERVSNHKKLRGGIVFVDSIPKSPAGKILRRLLTNRKKSDNKKT